MKRRKPREGLTRERIVAAAADLIEREGIEALSARRLAAELGCEAMSLYHHVPNMGELLRDVTEQALGTLPLPRPDARIARRQIYDMATAFLDLARTRPQVFRVVATRRWRNEAEARFQAALCEILLATGLTARAALRRARILLVYLNGAGLALTSWALDTTQPDPESIPVEARKFLKLSNPASISNDLDAGTEILLDALLAER
ncbi:MAG TPA: TetR/AcrR family transcriptional regulator [Rudaea sp.]|nr:TetR/AcrR family transcriptional regulator [Rudaea sp.]